MDSLKNPQRYFAKNVRCMYKNQQPWQKKKQQYKRKHKVLPWQLTAEKNHSITTILHRSIHPLSVNLVTMGVMEAKARKG